VRFDGFDDTLNPLHHIRKFVFNLDIFKTQVFTFLDIRHKLGGPNEGFAGNAAGIQALPTHFMFFHQDNFPFGGRHYIAGNQPARSCSNHHHVVIKCFGFLELTQHFSAFIEAQHFFG